MGADSGVPFALDEYVVPNHGVDTAVQGGSMPRAPKDKGGLFADVNRNAAGPGPGWYNKEIFNQSFVQNLKGGGFKRSGRNSTKLKSIMPSVGQYNTELAFQSLRSRARGGVLSKLVRKSYITRQAEKNTIPDPCQYNPKKQEAHMDSPVFASPRNVSRVPQKSSPMGPGYYNPQHEVVEKKVLCYSGCKEDAKSFLDKIMNKNDKGPAPGYLGIPESKVQDRKGQALHSARLLMDRPVVARSIDRAR
jgi:hypothetical protein